jgi:uncharacterized membrane protein
MATAEENRILNVYGALAFSLILMLVPHWAAALLSLIVFSGVLTVAYRLRRKAQPHGLMEDHMTFVVRTIWIGLLLTFVTTVIGGLYMLVTMDQRPLQSCAAQAAEMLLANNTPDMNALNNVMQPCLTEFMQVNAQVMMMALLISAILPLIYFAMRIARGMGRARGGHRIGNVKSWF